MIKAIVFSNNSPNRLEEFLQSVVNNEILIFDFYILYNSDEIHQEYYNRIFEKFNILNSIKETNFKENLLSILNSSGKFVAFFKDTNYFFSKITEINFEELMSDDDVFCFSLILGRNIKKDSNNDIVNVLIEEKSKYEKIIKWNWTKHYLSFGRPLELGGGHIFRNKDIYKIFKKWNFNDIIQLENSFDSLEYFPRESMFSFEKSILIDLFISENDINLMEKLKEVDFDKISETILKI